MSNVIEMRIFLLAVLALAGWTRARSDHENWMPVPEPTDEIVECAKHSEIVAVPRPGDGVNVDQRTPAGVRLDRPGPALPFDAGTEFRTAARWTTLQLEDGWLVGRAKGEWGGGLWWFPSTGPPATRLLSGNVPYVARTSGGVYALEEEDFVTGTSIALVDLRVDGEGHWSAGARHSFEGEALQVLDDGIGDLYILSRQAILHWNGIRLRTVLRGMDRLYDLTPFSLAADESDLDLGMRLLWLRVGKDGSNPQWFMPARCATFEMREELMVYAGYSATVPRCVCTAGP